MTTISFHLNNFSMCIYFNIQQLFNFIHIFFKKIASDEVYFVLENEQADLDDTHQKT